MTQPAGPLDFSLLALAIAALGPVLGPFSLIVFAAGAGAGLALSAQGVSSRWEGFRFWIFTTFIALLLTSPCVWIVAKLTDMPANIALIPVAFVLGAGRSQLLPFITKAFESIPAVLGALSNAGKRGTGP